MEIGECRVQRSNLAPLPSCVLLQYEEARIGDRDARLTRAGGDQREAGQPSERGQDRVPAAENEAG